MTVEERLRDFVGKDVILVRSLSAVGGCQALTEGTRGRIVDVSVSTSHTAAHFRRMYCVILLLSDGNRTGRVPHWALKVESAIDRLGAITDG